jgi:hypothetical protein
MVQDEIRDNHEAHEWAKDVVRDVLSIPEPFRGIIADRLFREMTAILANTIPKESCVIVSN